MTQESLARKFRPAGFDQPEGSRGNYTKPRPELQEAFDRWLEDFPGTFWPGEQYERAGKMLDRVGEFSIAEVNSLLVNYKPGEWNEEFAGLFISACYNRSSQNVIVFDVETEGIHYIGYTLDKKKVLINNGRAGMKFGHSSSGIVINNLSTDLFSANGFKGIFIQNGDGCEMVDFGSSGIFLFLDKSSYRYPDVLKKYLEELCDMSKSIGNKESFEKFIQKYGNGSEWIESEIKRMLKKP